MQSLAKTIDAALSHKILYEIFTFSILSKFLVQIYVLYFLQIIACAMTTKIKNNAIFDINCEFCYSLHFEIMQ